ncbi:glycosyltransferase family 4 protein [Patescibacteria group bacterium]|nr:glycosyltransferase family 4 protein [Patescibacteria group bacterium]
MKIVIDARIYITGIGRYTRNLLQELSLIDTTNNYTVILRQDGFENYTPPNPNFKKILADYAPYSFAEQILLTIKLLKQRPDLVHFTNFNIPLLYPGAYVLTIHDLIHMSHSTFGSSTRSLPYYYFKKIVYFFAIRLAAHRAKKILVPSEATKKDIIRHLKVSPLKIVVTHEGLDSKLTSNKKVFKNKSNQVLEKYGIKCPYLLYVGTMYQHKNHRRLIKAHKMGFNPQRGLNPKLVLVGKVDTFSHQLKKEVDQAGMTNQIIFPGFTAPGGYAPDEDLHVLYQNALAYIFPSLKEGFGIPILEAQAQGLPVLCSRISCLPEIAGDSALYFDPYSEEDIADKIRKVMEDKKLRGQLISNGYQNIKRFSWEKMARETLSVYVKK